ncbi:SigE family RNA polymerase sigma factor [Nocardioides sp.]|uniref:SigE family RNA polymerase sigma factor n=1 Tax=Nocardioides sp. TaxID=35761 RepID=UPI002718A8CB|nr:SigE family RNA polymerase sigma factor [Nocardioides sp.]MDO9456976.1 SigE family RNA polymerase sigma factor [Nocardioides sp.]
MAKHDEEFRVFAASALGPLRATGYLMCGDWHRAEDAAQEALVRLYLAWSRVERTEALLAYARRTTVRILVDESRRAWRRRERPGDPGDLGDLDRPAADPAERVVESEALVSALAQLAPQRRACVVLRYYGDLSVAETARALGCSEGTVKSQTSDALRALRPLLDDTVTPGRNP